jgi:hypothetical protein
MADRPSGGSNVDEHPGKIPAGVYELTNRETGKSGTVVNLGRPGSR